MPAPWRSVRSANAPSVQVAVGLGVVGAGSAAAMAVGARSLSEQSFAAYATWWTLANLVGLSFAVVEGYLPRLIVARRSAGASEKATIAVFTRWSLAVALLVVIVCLVTSPLTAERVFAGQYGLAWLLGIYVLAQSLQSLQRGVAVGRSRFGLFPVQLGSDGLVRAGGSALAWLLGASSPEVFAAVVCMGAAVGVVAGALREQGWFQLTPARVSVDPRPILLLAAAAVGPLVVNNIGVPWLAFTGQVEPLAVGAMGGALLLSRLPTLMVGAAYGPVLTPLSQAVEDGEPEVFTRLHRRAWWVVVGLGCGFVVAFAVLGPVALSLFLGPEYALPLRVLVLLAASSGLIFLAVVEQAALVALTAWHRVALAWLVGLLAMGGVLLLPVEPVERISWALVAAPLGATAVMALNRHRMSRLVFGRSGGMIRR